MNPQNSNSQQTQTSIQLQKVQFYQGDIPHPEILKGLQEISPDFPERVFKIAEAAAEEKIRVSKEMTESQKSIIEGQTKFNTRGQFLTFALFALVLGVTVLLAFMGMTGPAIAACVGGFATIGISAINGMNGKK